MPSEYLTSRAVAGPDCAFDRDREALTRLVQVLPEMRAQDTSLVLGDISLVVRISNLGRGVPQLDILLTFGSWELVISNEAVID